MEHVDIDPPNRLHARENPSAKERTPAYYHQAITGQLIKPARLKSYAPSRQDEAKRDKDPVAIVLRAIQLTAQYFAIDPNFIRSNGSRRK